MKTQSYLLILALVSLTALAHQDDPKLRDRVPCYKGPGYRYGQSQKVSIDFPKSQVTLMSWLPLGEFGPNHTTGNDCWGYVSPSGREYALVGLSHGTGFVDITNPSSPQIVGVVDGLGSLWRDIKVYQHHAYIVTEAGSGIQVVDMSQIDAGILTQRALVDPIVAPWTHNVAIDTDSGYLYRCGGDENGLRIYSLANPDAPVKVGEWQDRYVHDVQVVTYSSGPYAGRQIAFACSGFNGGSTNTGLSILDVTDKAAIQVLANYEYPSAAYSHQGWLSSDKRYFYLGDEYDERTFHQNTTTHVIDVSDLSNPHQVSTFSSGRPSIDHNLYVRGNLIFQANYRSGLRVFDATNPIAPQEVAFFDTWETDDQAQFNGLWSSYPFFPSGTVIGSDFEKGLFVWRLDYKQPQVVNNRLLFPWISNSNDYESTLHLSNYGTEAATVTLTARRANGDQQVSEQFPIPARGFLELKASEVFANLGKGPGYSVVAESSTTSVSGRWTTYDRVNFSPSQGVAVELSGENDKNNMLDNTVNLGSLPLNENFTSAPVLINTADTETQITVYYFDASGLLKQTDVQNLVPLRPWVPRVNDANLGPVYAVATSVAKITGVVFIFNPEGQTAIGPSTGIDNFQPPQ